MELQALPSLRRVLAWAVDQGMVVHGQVSEEQLAALERTFSGKEPWSFEHYEPLRGFGYALARLSLPDLPALLNVGDALQALDELRASTLPAWPTHHVVAETTFRELGYASTSESITRVRDANAAAWREHGANGRELLLRGAERARGPRAVVIGAGKLYDIPLRKLAERFEQLLLVDIDAAALADSVERVGLEPKLQARLKLVRADVTGINDVFVERAGAALARADEVEVYDALLRVLYEYRLDGPPRLVPDGVLSAPLDFACSSMVLSQLATPLTSYVQDGFARRFPASVRTQSLEFQVALGQFAHRVQLAHLRSLLAAAPCVALSTDTLDGYTTLDGRGNVVQSAVRLPLLGAPTVSALVPRLQARQVLTAQWQWRHVEPTRSKPRGRTVQVEGIVAERI